MRVLVIEDYAPLRNAIVHGLESEPVRIRRGKSPIGEIRLDLRRKNHEVVFEFSDDGMNRRGGSLVLLGQRLEAVELEPFLIQ